MDVRVFAALLDIQDGHRFRAPDRATAVEKAERHQAIAGGWWSLARSIKEQQAAQEADKKMYESQKRAKDCHYR